MIQDRDIIVIGIQPWDLALGSNCKNIAIEFSKKNRVLYVNYPLDRFTAWRQKENAQVKSRMEVIKGQKEDLVKVTDNLWNLSPRTMLESVSQIRFNGLFDLLNHINNKRYAKEILSAVKRLNFKNFILFNDSDMFRGFYMKELLKPEMSVYYSRDNLLAVDFWKVQGLRIEPALMAKSDLVTANSTYLADLARKYNPNSYYVGQGCDLTIYDKQLINMIPADMIGINKPVIGYTGALYGLRLDTVILSAISRYNPSWNIVLIGPEDDTFRNSELHQLPNVHFLGNKKPDELPAYVNCFDVAINPQKLNEVTRGNYPRKIDEYLALGKPVVATRTEAMSVFAEHTYLADHAEDYGPLIEKALLENSIEQEHQREVFARSHSWENSVEEISKAIEKVRVEKRK